MTMGTTRFLGQKELVDQLDAAAKYEAVEKITAAVQDTLVKMITSGALRLPEELQRLSETSYARRLVHKSLEHGYTVVAMVWGPGQGTALHDHSGSWCVEGVLKGEIEVTQYDLLRSEGDRWHFCRQECLHSYVGSAGSLIPPFDYHTIANARDDRPAVTLHVYGRELEQCSVFEGGEDGWYTHHTRELRYDA
jgi:predicted metal-dependent enzyme (double-stranded beta helix superfamily)